MRRFRLLPAPHTRDTALAFIAGCRDAWHGDRHTLWLAVADAADGAVVGGVHLLGVSLGSARAQLGYWTLPEHQRRGYATAAAGRLADWAFRELRVARLTLETHVANAASRRVAESLGCTLEAVFRSHREFGDSRADCVLFGLATARRRRRRRRSLPPSAGGAATHRSSASSPAPAATDPP